MFKPEFFSPGNIFHQKLLFTGNFFVRQIKHATIQNQQKITKALRTKKNYSTFQDKKNPATTWDKKIIQPLGEKKSRNLSGHKNQATSWDKKKLRNLLGEKLMESLKTKKKITHSFETKK